MLIAELLAGEREFPDVLQTVRRRLLDILVLGPDQLEEVGDNLEIGSLNLMYML